MTSRGFLKIAATGGIAVGLALAGASSAGAAPTYAVSEHIAMPDGGFDYVTFDPVMRRVYISRRDGLTALDVDTGKLTAHLADGARTHEPLPLAGGTQVLLTNGATNSARLLDAKTGALILDIPTAARPDAAILDAASGLVLVMTHSGAVTLIDSKTDKPVGDITVGGALEFAAVDGHGRAYVNVEDKNEIAVLDLATHAVVGRYPLKGCESPGGLGYDARTGLLLSACQNNVAKVIRAADGAEVASLAIGKGPDAVLMDARRHLAFIPCGRDGVLEVVALRGAGDVAVVGSVPTQPGARTGAVDLKTGKIYLPSAAYTLAAGGRPTPTPGTFQIIVVSPN